MPRAGNIAQAVELRRGEIERQQSSGAQYFKVTGEVGVNGTGEAVIDVAFPLQFVDKPSFSFGPQLGTGQPYVKGSLPIGDMTVLRWNERIRDDGTVVYVGATLGMVTSGPDGQVMILQWHMEGIGLRGPVPSE